MKKTVITVIVGAGIIFAVSATAMPTGHGGGNNGHGNGAAAAEEKTVSANGVVTAIDADGQHVTLDHEPIPALNWPPMTMELDLADPALAEGLEPGDEIVFDLKRLSATDYVITAIRKRH